MTCELARIVRSMLHQQHFTKHSTKTCVICRKRNFRTFISIKKIQIFKLPADKLCNGKYSNSLRSTGTFFIIAVYPNLQPYKLHLVYVKVKLTKTKHICALGQIVWSCSLKIIIHLYSLLCRLVKIRTFLNYSATIKLFFVHSSKLKFQ